MSISKHAQLHTHEHTPAITNNGIPHPTHTHTHTYILKLIFKFNMHFIYGFHYGILICKNHCILFLLICPSQILISLFASCAVKSDLREQLKWHKFWQKSSMREGGWPCHQLESAKTFYESQECKRPEMFFTPVKVPLWLLLLNSPSHPSPEQGVCGQLQVE